MAARLSKFTAGELAKAVDVSLLRGRPSKAVRARLESEVQEAIADGVVAVRRGKLVKV
jgi:hypothetical protein